MRMKSIWQRRDWPQFRWDKAAVEERLPRIALLHGKLLGQMKGVGFDIQSSVLEALAQETIKSSAIEGERLDALSVRSSIARRLQLKLPHMKAPDAKTEGAVDVLIAATQGFSQKLTSSAVCDWQKKLFPDGHSGGAKIVTGKYRKREMHIVSNRFGDDRVYYEAPPPDRLRAEMRRFLNWFNSREHEGHLRAAIAHFWSVTIHPFEDGNGRIARAITERALAQFESSGQRMYSLSAEIDKRKNAYYEVLERNQKGDLDITSWLGWFFDCLEAAFDSAQAACEGASRSARFWTRASSFRLNERQRKVLRKILSGFEGNITAKKWMKLGNCSLATAQRDLSALVAFGLLIQNPGGSKNTSYELVS